MSRRLDAAPLAVVAASVPEDTAPSGGAAAPDAEGSAGVGLILAGEGVGADEHGGGDDEDGLEAGELHF